MGYVTEPGKESVVWWRLFCLIGISCSKDDDDEVRAGKFSEGRIYFIYLFFSYRHFIYIDIYQKWSTIFSLFPGPFNSSKFLSIIYIYALVARQQSFRLSDLKIRRKFIVRISKRRFHFRTSFESLVSSNMSIFWSSQRYKLAEYLLRYTRVSNSYASR